jgi:hypothetical protein
MAKHTQAHMSRTVPKYKAGGQLSDMTRKQIEYYMGAKLLEIGVAPKSAIYRWTSQDKGHVLEWTYSSYWEGDKARILAEEAQG